MARLSSLMRQRSWKIPSAWLRVLTKTSVVLCALISRVDFGQGVARRMAGPGQALGGVEHVDIGCGAAFGNDEIGAAQLSRRAAAP